MSVEIGATLGLDPAAADPGARPVFVALARNRAWVDWKPPEGIPAR